MIQIENTDVYGFESAIRGMRNPMNSWEKSDSAWADVGKGMPYYAVGKNDLKLMKQLVKAGTDHSKFMRMITVTCDIIAPMFWWAEMDTYKVGTVRNSCSKMHKIQSEAIDLRTFGADEMRSDPEYISVLSDVAMICEQMRRKYNETGDKHYWRMLIELLPESYNQRATVQMNYAVLRNIYHARKNHKLDEWKEFCEWIDGLPYSELITGDREDPRIQDLYEKALEGCKLYYKTFGGKYNEPDRE